MIELNWMELDEIAMPISFFFLGKGGREVFFPACLTKLEEEQYNKKNDI